MRTTADFSGIKKERKKVIVNERGERASCESATSSSSLQKDFERKSGVSRAGLGTTDRAFEARAFFFSFFSGQSGTYSLAAGDSPAFAFGFFFFLQLGKDVTSADLQQAERFWCVPSLGVWARMEGGE